MKISSLDFHRITSVLLYASIIAGLIVAFVPPHGSAAHPAAALAPLGAR